MAKTKNTFFSNVIDLFAKRCAGEKKKIREVSVGCLKKRRGGGGSKLELFNFGDTKCTMM